MRIQLHAFDILKSDIMIFPEGTSEDIEIELECDGVAYKLPFSHAISSGDIHGGIYHYYLHGDIKREE